MATFAQDGSFVLPGLDRADEANAPTPPPTFDLQSRTVGSVVEGAADRHPSVFSLLPLFHRLLRGQAAGDGTFAPARTPRCLPVSIDILTRLPAAKRSLSVGEVRALVLDCGKAVAEGNRERFRVLERELRAAASPLGPAAARLAQFFADALAARVAGDAMQRLVTDFPQDQEVRTCMRPG